MKNLAFEGNEEKGKEIISLLENFGGINVHNIHAIRHTYIYFIDENDEINMLKKNQRNPDEFIIYKYDDFVEKNPFKIGDIVLDKHGKIGIIKEMKWFKNIEEPGYKVEYNDITMLKSLFYSDELIKVTHPFDIGNMSDGYHTFNELYKYRLLYNAALFNEFAKQNLYDVHKSKLHSDGEIPFGDKNWFIVMAELPNGQISNHYEMKDWDLFNVPEKKRANVWDGHTPQDVINRLIAFLKK